MSAILAVSAAAKAGKDVSSLLVKQMFTEALTPETIEMLLEDPDRLVGAFSSPAVVRKFFANADFQAAFFNQASAYRNQAIGTLIGEPVTGPYDTIDQVGGYYRVVAAMMGLDHTAYTGWDAILNDSVSRDAVANSTSAMAAVAASTTAMDAVIASTSAMDAVANSAVARTAIGTSGLFFDAISSSTMAIGKYVAGVAGLFPSDYASMAAVAASTTAMNAVIASTTAMNAVIASTTAMDAVAASTSAMDAVANSTVAMDAITDSTLGMTTFFSAYSARLAFWNNDAAIATIIAKRLNWLKDNVATTTTVSEANSWAYVTNKKSIALTAVFDYVDVNYMGGIRYFTSGESQRSVTETSQILVYNEKVNSLDLAPRGFPGRGSATDSTGNVATVVYVIMEG
jgi:hypothetical protein